MAPPQAFTTIFVTMRSRIGQFGRPSFGLTFRRIADVLAVFEFFVFDVSVEKLIDLLNAVRTDDFAEGVDGDVKTLQFGVDFGLAGRFFGRCLVFFAHERSAGEGEQWVVHVLFANIVVQTAQFLYHYNSYVQNIQQVCPDV